MKGNYLIGKTNSVKIQLFRYLWVGGLAFIVDYGCLFLFTDIFSIDYLVSAAIAFLLGLIVNYLLSTIWVFNDSRLNNKMAEFAVFTSIGLVGLFLNEVVIYLFCEIIGLHYMISKLCSTAIVFFWNFFARKIILFTKTKKNTIL